MEKAADAADTSVLFFSQLVLIFKPRARKTMREECFTHFIISTRAISTRAISTSAISKNNAFCHAICRFFIVLLVIYAVLSRNFGANIFGSFLYLCYFSRFFSSLIGTYRIHLADWDHDDNFGI